MVDVPRSGQERRVFTGLAVGVSAAAWMGGTNAPTMALPLGGAVAQRCEGGT